MGPNSSGRYELENRTMRTSSKIFLLVIAIAVVVLLIVTHHSVPQSPEAQIASQINTAVAAANRNDANGVMSIISAHYHDENGYTNDLIHGLLIHAMRGRPSDRVSLTGNDITVQGDTATSEGYLLVVDAQSGRSLYSRQISLRWQKEPARS